MEGGGLLVHLVTALGAALAGAAVALRLRQPLIIGYVLAGVAIGPSRRA
jgi:CPA2 family monovalent cation:H+ antiporter-2